MTAAVLLPLAGLSSQAKAAGCDRFAAARGSDGNSGTSAAPFRTAQALANSLAPGQTGCLAAGESFEGPLRLARGGQPLNPVTITSGAGGRATMRGRVWFTPGAHDVIIQNVLLDGRNPDTYPSPLITADRVVLRNNDITNAHTGICVAIGKSDTSYAATVHDVVIEGNRIHDCGRLPATNHDHGIYVEASRGARIVGNFIYDNADRGIQFYPDADNSLVTNNVIDGNGMGVLFSGANGTQSSGNVVQDNVVTNSVGHNVASWWDGVPAGTGNMVTGNCISGGRGTYGDIAPPDGFTVSGTVRVNPQFVNRAAKDFRVPAGSACAGKVPDAVAAPAAPIGATPPSGTSRPMAGIVPTPKTPSPARSDTRAPALRLSAFKRSRRPALRIVVSDNDALARVVVRGPGVKRSLVPRRHPSRLRTTVRFSRLGLVKVVAIDRAGNRRIGRFLLRR